MKKCKFEGCGRKTWKKSEWCIFHEPSKDKDADLFWKGIDEMMKREDYNFGGFYFIARKGEYTIDFDIAKFKCDVNFLKSTFLTNTKFNRTKFYRDAFFDEVVFIGDAYFNYSEFLGNADFEKVTFSKTAQFDNAIFFEDALFSWATFIMKVSFFNTQFNRNTFFDNTTFSNYSLMFNTKFQHVIFIGVSFINPEQAQFHYVNLSKAIFSPTIGLEKIDFLSPEWAEINGRKGLYIERILDEWSKVNNPYYGIGERKELLEIINFILFASKHIEGGDKKRWIIRISDWYSEVETLYRQLKINYERKRNYPDAGDFYIGEVEMKMKNPKTSKFEKFILFLYKFISYYGESYKRALCWIGGLIFLSSYFLMATGMKVKERIIDYYPNLPQNPDGLNDFIELVNVVVRSITLQPSIFAKTTSTASRIILTLTAILGILFIALFILALRRRFRR